MKKKFLSLALCLAFSISLFGCASGSGKEPSYNVDDCVTLGEYKGITVTGQSGEVTQEDIEQYMQTLIDAAAPYMKDTSKTKVTGDSIVNVDYVGKKNGVAFEGGAAKDVFIDVKNNCEATQSSPYIEGFSSGLVGAAVGETIDCNVTFPSDYSSTDLAGKEVVFQFTINYIAKEVTPDTIDAQYVKDNFGYDTMEVFEEAAKKGAQSQKDSQRETQMRSSVVSAVVDNAKYNLPKKVIEARFKEKLKQYEQQYCSDGSSLKEYVTSSGMDYQTFEKNVREDIKEALKQELAFEAIAKKEKIEFDEEGYREYITGLMTNYGLTTEEDLYAKYASDVKDGEAYLKKIYLCNKAVTFCIENANVK